MVQVLCMGLRIWRPMRRSSIMKHPGDLLGVKSVHPKLCALSTLVWCLALNNGR